MVPWAHWEIPYPRLRTSASNVTTAAYAYSFRLLPGYEQSIGPIALKRPRLNRTWMHVLKLIYQTTKGLFKQAWMFPQSVTFALKQRRRQFALNLIEAERLDRIRNPSKYLGK